MAGGSRESGRACCLTPTQSRHSGEELRVADHTARTSGSSPKAGPNTPMCSVLASGIGAAELGPTVPLLEVCNPRRRLQGGRESLYLLIKRRQRIPHIGGSRKEAKRGETAPCLEVLLLGIVGSNVPPGIHLAFMASTFTSRQKPLLGKEKGSS